MNKELIKSALRMKYNIKKDMKVVSSSRLEIVEIAKRSYMSNYTVEEIEDAFQDSLLYNYKRATTDPKYSEKITVSSITFKMREFAYITRARRIGYTLKGAVPQSGKNLHIQNYVNSTGKNLIEKIGYNESEKLVIGT